MRRFGPVARALRGSLLFALLACSGGPDPDDGGPRHYRAVSPGVAFEMLRDNPDLVVIDVRPFAQYESPTGHLERALSLPAGDLPQLWPAMGIGSDETILIYGAKGAESQEAAIRYLVGVGQRYVVQIEGGLEAWRQGAFHILVEDAPLSPVRLD